LPLAVHDPFHNERDSLLHVLLCQSPQRVFLLLVLRRESLGALQRLLVGLFRELGQLVRGLFLRCRDGRLAGALGLAYEPFDVESTLSAPLPLPVPRLADRLDCSRDIPTPPISKVTGVATV
jgi:hypothetical protein